MSKVWLPLTSPYMFVCMVRVGRLRAKSVLEVVEGTSLSLFLLVEKLHGFLVVHLLLYPCLLYFPFEIIFYSLLVL